MDVRGLQEAVVAFASQRDWGQFHDPKNLCMALASEVGELSAILRWVPTSAVDAHLSVESARSAFTAEIADITILLLLLYERTGLDFGSAVLNKLAQNAIKYPIELSRGLAEPPEPSGPR